MKRIISAILVISLMLSLCSFSGYAAEEIIFSDGFEQGTDGWEYWSAVSKETCKLSEDAYSEGKQAYYVCDSSTSSAVGLKGKMVEIKAGETYTACADIYVISGSVTMFFKYFDANKKQLFSKSAAGKSGKWSVAKVTQQAPEGAAYAQIILCGSNAALGEGYYDNARIYKGEVTPTVASDAKAPAGSSAPVDVVFEDNYKDGDVIMSESFENGLPENWTKKGTLVMESRSDKASDGTKSFYVVDDTTERAGGIASYNIPVAAGNMYSATADIFDVVGATGIYIKYFNAEGTQLESISKGGGATNEFGQAVLLAKAPAGTAYAQVWFHTGIASLQTAYVDNIKFIKGAVKVEEKEAEYIEPKQSPAVNASIVAPVNNKLQYTPYTEYGDIIGDYSYGGFYAGEYELPVSENLPVAATISPSGTDNDTDLIQDTIDKVYNEASDDRMKVIKLKAGKYNIDKRGIIVKSGIVLSGEGQGPTGTILYAKDASQYVPVKVAGAAPKKLTGNFDIIDEYIPAGSKKINISAEDAANLKPGDIITIFHPSEDAWCEAVKMKGIINVYNDDTSWKKGKTDVSFERTVTAVNGTEITLDFGVFFPLTKSLSKSYVYKIDESGKAQNIGIENLRIESYYNGDPNDENHATTAISVTNAKNIFIRNVSSKYFYSSLISCGRFAKQVTVLNCSSLQPVSKVAGSRRYSFAASTSAQQLLYTGCYSYDGRHDFETSLTVTGPISYVDNLIDKSNTASETHGTWSTGVLYDNLYQVGNGTKGFFAFANRGIYGTQTSQGWSSASAVMWNCLATTMIAHKPPHTYQNFIVGSWGLYQDAASLKLKDSNTLSYKKIYRTSDMKPKNETEAKSTDPATVAQYFPTKEGSPAVGDAYIENEFTPVEPRSLYKAQLAERFTGNIQNSRPNAPVIVYPRADKETNNKTVSVSGAYQLGAEAVTVYIDDTAYKANLNPADNSFVYSMDLAEGVHKIYATQTIGGVEGCKSADRFITIGKANGNPDYLQSIYSPDKTRMIINDPRPTYDVYEKTLEEELANKITVLVNDVPLVSDVEPFETNGRVLVPMRAIFEAINATVTWDEATATATAVKDTTTVKITENQSTAYVNGNPITLDVPAMIVSGRFVVPVRFISESFGCEVDWIDARRTVTIKGGGILFYGVHNIDGELDIYGLVQSGDDGAGSVIQNMFDNAISSGWSVGYSEEKPDAAFGIIDFGSVKELNTLGLILHSGTQRKYTYDFYVSDDNVNYTFVKSWTSSGATSDFEEVDISAKGRYFKMISKGNSVNHWSNIKEFYMTGK